ncbi:MAG: L-threonylcarbamoyladenylate synthase [Gammaproteobacteria bacterium]|nr:L-threonylcarbamoyladenylate synthase [Gammaproteobacteria bacterium]
MSPWQINRLSKAVLRGDVFAYPTDTIWGFGCHPLIAASVQRILSIKKRPANKGLILLCSTLDHIDSYISDQLSDEQVKRLQHIDEQPTTWLVKASQDCPLWLRGQHPTIAVRLTMHPFVQALCNSIKAPLVSTSANRAGQSTVTNATQARKQFGDEVDYIVSGYSTGGKTASAIKLLENNRIIRGNNISKLEAV